MNRQFFRSALVALTALALTACASSFRSNVTSFHVSTPPAGAKVFLVPIDEARQDSLEYRQYASSIQAVLEQNGFTGARDSEPDYIIGFDVAVSDGREKIRSYPRSGFAGGAYWHRGYAWGGWWSPYYGYGPGTGDELSVRTVYRAELRLEIREPDGTMIFEGIAESETRSRSLPELVPLLAEALFEDFPGANGLMRTVRLDMEGRDAPRRYYRARSEGATSRLFAVTWQKDGPAGPSFSCAAPFVARKCPWRLRTGPFFALSFRQLLSQAQQVGFAAPAPYGQESPPS